MASSLLPMLSLSIGISGADCGTSATAVDAEVIALGPSNTLDALLEVFDFEGVSAPNTARRSEARSLYAGADGGARICRVVDSLATEAVAGLSAVPFGFGREPLSASSFLVTPCRHVSLLERLSLCN